MKPLAQLLRPHWRATLILALGAALNYGDRAAISSILPALRDHFGLSDLALGMLGSLFLWSYAISSPFAGMVADRDARNKTVTYSLFGWSAVMVLTGFVSQPTQLYVLRVALGCFESFYIPAAIALVAGHHQTSTRARGINTLLISISLGVVVSGYFSGHIVERWGWRYVFWDLGLAGIALAILFHFFLPPSAVLVIKRPERPRFAEVLRYLLRTPSFLIMLLKALLGGVAGWSFFAWLPLYFHENYQMNLGSAGFAGNFFSEASAILGLAAGAWISDFLAARNVRHRILLFGLCYLTASPLLLLFVAHPSFTMISAALLFYGFLRGTGDANELTIVCEIIPAGYRSTAIGLMNTFATSAGGVGVLLAGLAKQSLGLSTVFAALSALIFLSSLLLLIGYRFFLSGDMARATDHGSA